MKGLGEDFSKTHNKVKSKIRFLSEQYSISGDDLMLKYVGYALKSNTCKRMQNPPSLCTFTLMQNGINWGVEGELKVTVVFP